MEETIFAKIIRHEAPAEIVYEDADTLAFLSIAPRTKGHTLVVPKEPARNILDIGDHPLFAVMKTARKIASALQKAVGAEGMNISINNEAAAGQVVFYFHVHVIPRFGTRGGELFPEEGAYRTGEMQTIGEKIRAALAAMP